MASRIRIKGYLVDDKGTWVVRARFPDTVDGKAKLHSKSTGLKVAGSNKRKAEAAMHDIVEQWEKDVNDRTVINDEITLGQCIDSWLETKAATVKFSTAESYDVYYRSHIRNTLGSIRLKDLTRQDIQRYFNSLEGVISPNTMIKHRVIINGALEEAVLNGWLFSDAGNVLKRVHLPKKKGFEGTVLTEEQIKTVFQSIITEPEPVHAAVILGLCYGLRRSEICGLRWKDVDFDDGIIHIRNTVTDYNGTRIESETTKTLRSRRDIPMIDNTIGYLKSLYEKRVTQGLISDKVCAHEDGHPVFPDYLTRHVKIFLTQCGIEGVRLHDLRHTAATILVKRMPVVYVSAFLGHNQVSTTLNVYSHVLGSEREKASLEMNAYLSGVIPSSEEDKRCSEKCSESPSMAS